MTEEISSQKNFAPTEKKEEEPTKKMSRRAWLILILILVVVIEAVVFLSVYRASQEALKNVQTENEQMSSKIKAANEQIEALEAEKSKCATILSRPAGEFAEYEYCKELLQKFPL